MGAKIPLGYAGLKRCAVPQVPILPIVWGDSITRCNTLVDGQAANLFPGGCGNGISKGMRHLVGSIKITYELLREVGCIARPIVAVFQRPVRY